MAAFDEKDYTRSFDWSIWKRLTPFVRPFRRDFVGMLVFNGLCALVDVAIPLFQRYAIRGFIQVDSLRGIVPFSVLLISHRVTTLMQADRILVLDGGRVSALGAHRELIDRPGIYRDIYDIQMRSDDRALVEEGGNA